MLLEVKTTLKKSYVVNVVLLNKQTKHCLFKVFSIIYFNYTVKTNFCKNFA